MKILIRNLDRETTDDELKRIFSAFGKVQYCTIVREKNNGLSKGFGFVEMPRPGDAKAAIKNLNDSMIGANRVRVKYAQSLKAKPPASAEKHYLITHKPQPTSIAYMA